MTKFKTTTVKWKDEEDAKLFAAINVEDEGQAESDDDFDVEDQKAHSNLINDITKISKRKRITPAPRNVRASAEEGGTRVDSKDILKRIGQTDLTNAVKKISTLPKPQEKFVLRRLKRAAGYEKVSAESEKWQNLVSRRRTADQLKFPLQAPDVRVHTALKTEETKMKTPLEQEVYSLLLGAKMMEDKKETEAELTRKRAMSLEELKERNRLAWKLKAEKRKLEYKAWQQNKNKSRKFHRLLRREKLKKQKAELEQLENTNPEAALEMLEELERARVEERMTLRHKQSKWAHLQGFRATRDPKAMTALKENKDVHQELLAKRKRQESSSEEEEEENIEEKLEALKKERQAAIEAGLFDPANPWTAGLFEQVPDRLAVTADSAIDDSFVNFKKFWDEVNRRRLRERLAQKMAERDVCDHDDDGENGEVGNDDNGEDGEVDTVTDGEVDNDDEVGNEEMEATDDNGDEKTTENKTEKNSKKRKLKSGNKGETKKIRIKAGNKAAENNSDKQDNTVNKTDEEESTDDIEIKEDDKKGDEKKTKKGKSKKKKVIGCKSIKKSNLKDKGKKKKKKKETKKVSNKTKSGVKEGSKKTDDSGKKKKKMNKKQEEKEDVEENHNKDGKKVNKKEKKKNQNKKNKNTQNDAQKMNNENEKDDNETNINIRDKKVEENKDINKSNSIDLEEQLISIDSMFNQAELGLQRKLKKKLERMGIRKIDGHEWTKVQTKKKTKKVIKGETEREGKSILPKFEEYDFKIKKNLENLDETVERAKTLEDMDKLQNAMENEDQVQKALRTLQVAASKENGMGEESGVDKKQTAQKIVQVDPSKFIEIDAKKLLTAMPDTLGRGDEALDDDDDDEDNEAEDIIREAFADDYLVGEFKSEKDLAREQDKPKALCLAKPGWGNWTGPNLKMSNRLRKRFTIRAPKAPPRKDDTLGNVIYDEKADVHEKLRKVMVSELPFPFSSVKEFEASVRAPIGRLFVPEKQHQNLTAPPVVTKIGTIIEPMTEEELLKHEKRVKGPRKGDKMADKAHSGNKQTRQVGKRQRRQRGNSGKARTGIVNKRNS